MLQDALILTLDNTSDYLVVHLGASCHATHHRKFFYDYVQGDFGYVLLGDDEPCKIVGKGKVRIKLNNGNDWLLKDARAHSFYENKSDLNGGIGRWCLFVYIWRNVVEGH